MENSQNSCASRLLWWAALAIATLAGLVALAAILRVMGSALVVADPLEKSDAIVVLSGDEVWRLKEAARLYEDGLGNLVVLTETGVDIPDYGEYSTVVKFEAMQMGIPAGAIVITEKHASSTYEEARAVRQMAEQLSLEGLIIVTDPFHSLRTRLIFQKVFADSSIRIIIRPVREHWYRPSDWWLSSRGRLATLREYFSLIGFALGFK